MRFGLTPPTRFSIVHDSSLSSLRDSDIFLRKARIDGIEVRPYHEHVAINGLSSLISNTVT